MECKDAEKNIPSFFKGTLKGNELRKTYYHLSECSKCKELLLDEFSFYAAFNDLDSDLNFNYKKKLDEFMKKKGMYFTDKDSDTTRRYYAFSVLICLLFIVLIVIAIKVVYR